MGVRSRIKAYIRDDRPKKLKSYILSHDIDVNEVKLSDGQNALHFCAVFGSSDMLRSLLRLECDATKQDKGGNLPLHLAIQRALNAGPPVTGELLSSLVNVLQQAYPLGQDVENKQGLTPHDLLIKLKQKVRHQNLSTQQIQRDRERISAQDEERWRKKLEEEFRYECEENGSRYNADDDDFSNSHGPQSFDQWSEEILEDLSRRHHHHHIFWRDKKKGHKPSSQSQKGNPHQKENTQEEKLRQAREEMQKRYKPTTTVRPQALSTLVTKKLNYEKKFAQLLNKLPSKPLTFACIPWPHADLSFVVEVMFCDLPDKSGEEYRIYLRSQRIRWHPDKFTQRFGDRLHLDHVTKIMGKVKAISQILNKLESERVKHL